ncbi:MFS transporter [Novosphingobium sp. G106]|uniref:MFS transporter n=1 Tax=Novosphingobium sp. G106 TaxID=2849500 RepID=UPI001C2D08A1|nr:MFS transporter [Novosphingobium sp. G106]MBV1691838.1 MFS transporter [Novosphingobium sp. G106]MBV1692155.1 MFS transporter [Novosphingobium sp. G106]
MLRSVIRHKDNRYTTGPERDAPIINGRALAGLSLTTLMSSLATGTANVALPSLARMFAVSFQAAQWIVLAYLLTVAAMDVIAGRVGDVVGRRRLLLAGTTVFAGGSLLCGLARSFELGAVIGLDPASAGLALFAFGLSELPDGPHRELVKLLSSTLELTPRPVAVSAANMAVPHSRVPRECSRFYPRVCSRRRSAALYGHQAPCWLIVP